MDNSLPCNQFVSVHRLRVTSVQNKIEPRTRRKHGFAVEWPKVVGRIYREAGAACKWRIPAPISAFSRANITARGTERRATPETHTDTFNYEQQAILAPLFWE